MRQKRLSKVGLNGRAHRSGKYISSSQAMLDIIAQGQEEIKEIERGQRPRNVIDVNKLWG